MSNNKSHQVELKSKLFNKLFFLKQKFFSEKLHLSTMHHSGNRMNVIYRNNEIRLLPEYWMLFRLDGRFRTVIG